MTLAQAMPQAAYPALALAAGALAILVAELLLPPGGSRRVLAAMAVVTLALSLAAVAGWAGAASGAAGDAPAPPARGPVGGASLLAVDGLSRWAYAVVVAAALGALAVGSGEVDREEPAAFLALLLLAAAGMGLLAAARSLVVLFLGLELLSLSLYVLVAYRRDDALAREGALKYFVLGSFASGLLLMGIALVYGATGRFELDAVADLASVPTGATIGFALLAAGLAFKLALAPFHLWAPDAYQGAGMGVTAFMSVATKASAFVALVRLGRAAPAGAAYPLWVLAALSMLAGSLGALYQSDFRRLMAYSGIANAGYLLVALPAFTDEGVAASLFYLSAYLFANMGLFAVAAWVERQAGGPSEAPERVSLDHFRGLSARHPWMAWAAVLFLVSLTGLPVTGGFAGKIFLVGAAVSTGFEWLAFVLVASTAVLAYAYWSLARRMWKGPAAGGEPRPQSAPGVFEPGSPEPASPALYGLAALCAAGTLALGLFPEPLLHWVGRLVQGL